MKKPDVLGCTDGCTRVTVAGVTTGAAAHGPGFTLMVFATALLLEVPYCRAQQDAPSSKEYTREEIAQVFHALESTAVLASRMVEHMMDRLKPRDLEMLVNLVVESNPSVYGSAVAFEPGLYAADVSELTDGVSHVNGGDMSSFVSDPLLGLPIYCPYAHRTAGGVTTNTFDLAGGYDYTNHTSAAWYADPKRLFLRGLSSANESCREADRVFTRTFDNSTLGPCFWSDVYFDEGAGDIYMATYSAIIRTTKNMSYLGRTYDGLPSKPDATGKWFGGVITVDVSLRHIGARACPAEVCSSCPAGKQPSSENTDCVSCTDNTYSTYGICVACEGTAAADSVSGFPTQCAQCVEGKRYSERDLGCVCQHDHFTNVNDELAPKCEICDEEAMTCPGGGHIIVDAVSGLDQSTTGVFAQPKHWVDDATIRFTLDQYDGHGLAHVMKTFMWCDETVCLGTQLDRDWKLSPSGAYEYGGYCAGDKLHDVDADCRTRNATPCTLLPNFCRAGHTGRLCSSCINGAWKPATGHCCLETDAFFSFTLADFGVFFAVIPTTVLFAAWVVYRTVRVDASDSSWSALAFFFQMIRMVGQDNEWLAGIPLLEESVDILASAMSFESSASYWSQGSDNVCELAPCPSTSRSIFVELYNRTAIYPAWLLLVVVAIILKPRAFAAATYFKRDEEGNPVIATMDMTNAADRKPMLCRVCIGCWSLMFMPLTQSAMEMMIFRCYSTRPEGCEDLPFDHFLTQSELDSATADPVWLLKVDPAVVFLGSTAHRVAVAWATIFLCLNLVVMPILIKRGINGERTDASKVRRLGRMLSDASDRMRASIDAEQTKPKGKNSALDDEELAHEAVRQHYVSQKRNLYTPMYACYSGAMQEWWFLIDFSKKVSVSLAFAIGQHKPDSLWKAHVFLIIAIYGVLHTVYRPCPNLASNCFESASLACVLLMLYTASIPELADRVQVRNAPISLTFLMKIADSPKTGSGQTQGTLLRNVAFLTASYRWSADRRDDHDGL
jgi:hypothetical protein